MKEQQAAAEEAAKEEKQEEKTQAKAETRKQKQRNAAEMIAQKGIFLGGLLGRGWRSVERETKFTWE